jgi:AcrR family transcriptional regulator
MENPSNKVRLRRTTPQIKSLLMSAVGHLIANSGYHSLTEANIASQAKVGRQTIALYFGTSERLIEEYLQQDKAAGTFDKFLCDAEDPKQVDKLRFLLKFRLEAEYRGLLNKNHRYSSAGADNPKQKFDPEPDSMNAEKTDFLLLSAKHYFSNSAINYGSLNLMLQSSIKFLASKSELKDSIFHGIDTASYGGREQIIHTLKALIDLAFEQKNQK